jgi:hypothetical protein
LGLGYWLLLDLPLFSSSLIAMFVCSDIFSRANAFVYVTATFAALLKCARVGFFARVPAFGTKRVPETVAQ